MRKALVGGWMTGREGRGFCHEKSRSSYIFKRFVLDYETVYMTAAVATGPILISPAWWLCMYLYLSIYRIHLSLAFYFYFFILPATPFGLSKYLSCCFQCQYEMKKEEVGDQKFGLPQKYSKCLDTLKEGCATTTTTSLYDTFCLIHTYIYCQF